MIGDLPSASFLKKQGEIPASPAYLFGCQERVIRTDGYKKRVRERIVRQERRTWARVYGGSNSGGARDVRPTRDGGFIIASTLSSSWGYSPDAWLIKVSPAGQIEWQREYGESESDCSASAVQQTSDGGYIVAGEIRFSDAEYSDGFVLKLTPTGDVEWARVYGGDKEDELASIQQTSDGGYIAAGSSGDWGGGWPDLWVLKVFPDGDIDWQYRYGGEGSDEAYSIAQTGDGGYIVAGDTDSFGDEYHDIWVLKLSSYGAVEWQRAYGDYGRPWTSEYAFCVQQTMDGGYIVAGYSTFFDTPSLSMKRDIWIVKLFPSGDTEWQRLYDSGGSDGARFIEQTGDGGYVVAGHTESFRTNSLFQTGSSDTDVWILKLDRRGDVEWGRNYGWIGSDAPSCIHQLSDGGYIIGGSSYSYLGRGPSELLVFRIDAAGGIERMPEFAGETQAEVLDTHLLPRATSARPAKMDVVARTIILDAQDTFETSDLLFGPPLNLKGEIVLNRSLSQSEYTHALFWESNPSNDDLRIIKYRLYRMGGLPELLTELDAEVFSYVVRHVWREIPMTYAVSGVTEEGNEGLRALVTAR
ncbi:MAG: hypothetical protein ABIG80_05300 [Patescibacteria group bacterium]